jgi:vacuolar protein sorting-associated protein 45
MVHELIGVHLNKVDLSSRLPSSAKPEEKELILSSEFDSFYKTNMYSNIGEMAVAIKDMLDKYVTEKKKHEKIDSIDDMKNFMDNFKDYKKMSNNVSRHVTLMAEASKAIESRKLMGVSALGNFMYCY